MKIEAGKFYKTRDGQKVGPMRFEDGEYVTDHKVDGFAGMWTTSGEAAFFSRNDGGNSQFDLMSEWSSEGPVRTRTVTEIVPGRHGEIEVGQTNPIGANYVESVFIGFGSGFMIALDEAKLTAAIETLTQIRDALAAQGKE